MQRNAYRKTYKDEPKEWQLGHLTIQEATSYKYLGDLITNDGKNAKNLEAWRNKIKGTTVSINSIAANDTLKKIETKVLLELHEKVSIAGLLTNAESWCLSRREMTELDRIEIQARKYLFDLPAHTPTPAIIYTLGILYTKHRVDQKRFIYLHRILNRDNHDWTKRTFYILEAMNIGWSVEHCVTLRD